VTVSIVITKACTTPSKRPKNIMSHAPEKITKLFIEMNGPTTGCSESFRIFESNQIKGRAIATYIMKCILYGSIDCKTIMIMIEPPRMLPKSRNDIDAIFASSPTRFSGKSKNIGLKYSPKYFVTP